MSYHYNINGYDKKTDKLVLTIYIPEEHNKLIEYRFEEDISNGNEWPISIDKVHPLIRRVLQYYTGVPSNLEYYIGAVQG